MDDNAIQSIMKATGNENRHNWLYSFMNRTFQHHGSSPIETDVYLVGYCKQCNNIVSVKANLDYNTGFASLTKTDLPKFGCEPE